MSHLSPLLKQSSDIVAERGEGCYLYDASGQSWLDFSAGIGVTATGHCHPKVVEAAREQVGTLIHGQYATVQHRPMLDLANKLNEHLPESLDSVSLTNSGSEAVETALRLARQATGRANLIAFHGGFHGRTVGGASLTSSATKVRSGYHPMMGGVVFAPFPHAYRYGLSEDEATDFCLRELDELFVTQTAPDDTAAMIIEPVQGEYGYWPATTRFMQGLRERCDRYNILLIADEIQAGFGRTGKFWSYEHFGITPDILITAKGLASGFPLSGIAAPQSLMQKAWPGSQGGTYGANAVACAGALANIEVMREEKLVDNAASRGEQMRAGLEALKDKHDCIDEVRGLGLMQGLEIVDDHRQPDGDKAAALLKASEGEGLLLLRCGSHGQVVRWLPPLIVNEAQVNEALEKFTRALAQV